MTRHRIFQSSIVFIRQHQEVLFSLSLFLLILILHYAILHPILGMSLHGDDWRYRLYSKSLDGHHFASILDNLKKTNNSLYPIYHFYFLEKIWGFNVRDFQITNIFIKCLVGVSAYLLAKLLFKDRLLAIVTALLFTVGFTASASLEWVMLGSDYLSLLAINFFFIVYFLLARSDKINWKLMPLLPIFFFASVFFSMIRAYPLLVVPIIIELCLLVKRHSFTSIKASLARLLILYLPTLPTFSILNQTYFGILDIPILKQIINGNWQQLTLPLQGLGFILVPLSTLEILLGPVNLSSSNNYLHFILHIQKWPVLPLCLLLSYVLSKKPLHFFIGLSLLNLLLELALYPLFTHSMVINQSLRVSNDLFKIYPTLAGVLIISISVLTFLEWRLYQRKNFSLIAIWLGPIFSLLFILCTLIFADRNTGFMPIHRYLTMPSLGIYLFLAGIIRNMAVVFNPIKNNLPVVLGGLLITVFLLFYLQISRLAISDYYNLKLIHGRSLIEEEKMLNQLRGSLKKYNYDSSQNSLFVYDDSGDPNNAEFYEQGFLAAVTAWIHIPDNYLVESCDGLIVNNTETLSKYLVRKDGQLGFLYPSQCTLNHYDPRLFNGTENNVLVFYPLSSVYVFKLEDKSLFDIKEQVLEKLLSTKTEI